MVRNYLRPKSLRQADDKTMPIKRKNLNTFSLKECPSSKIILGFLELEKDKQLMRHFLSCPKCSARLFEKRIERYKRMLRADPNDYESIINIGFYSAIYGKKGEVDRYYKLGIEKCPKDSSAYAKLGYWFGRYRKRNDLAIVCYQKAFQLNSSDERAFNNRGEKIIPIKKRTSEEYSPKNCPSAKTMFGYIEDELLKERTVQIKRHIAKCSVCKDVVKAVITIKEEVEKNRVACKKA